MNLLRLSLRPLPAALSFVLGSAHFWRAGMPALSVCCVVWVFLVWCRSDWIRRVSLVLLPLLAGRWIWAAAQFVQLRIFMEQPWMRLACILLGVAAFTAVSALLLTGKWGDIRQGKETGVLRSAACLGTVAVLSPLLFVAPQVFLIERLIPGGAPLQILLAGLWGSWVAGKLADRKAAVKTRLRVWRLFSLVFFAQLALGIAGYGLFLMTGTLHLPVPGMILAAPLYRGGGLFMPVLFAVSVLLVGAAWCSHLCYFGVWDATAAAGRKIHPVPRWMAWSRLGMLAVVIVLPVVFRLSGVPADVAVGFGLLLGIALIPALILFSHRHGFAGYCLGVCPLGLVAGWLGRLSPWRIRKTAACTGCGACTHVCRYGAMTPEHLALGKPGSTCTLCRDCLVVCRHGGLTMTLWGHESAVAETVFIVLVSVLHAAFIAVARV